MITRSALLGSFRRRYTTVNTIVGPLRIRNLTEAEKEEFEAGNLKQDGKLNLARMRGQRRRLAVRTLVDEHGEQLLKDSDEEALRGLDSALLTAIFDGAVKHCGFSKDEVEELEKNSDAAPASNSPTDSPCDGQ